MDERVQMTCRRCIEQTEFDITDVLATRVPMCPSCGEPMVRQAMQSGIMSGADFALDADRRAMQAVRRVPGLIPLVKTFARLVSDDDLLLDRLADDIQVSDRQMPEIWTAYQEAGSRLDIAEDRLPPLFVDGDRNLNAYATGVNFGMVVVTVGALEILDEGELIAVLGHELGHVIAGHVPYTTAIQFARLGLGRIAGWTPVPWDDLVMLAANPAFLAWVRAAERTADRAGMIAARQPRDMLTALMKMAGAPRESLGGLDLSSFLSQAKRFDELRSSSVRRRVLVAEDVLRRSHPFPAVRVGELVELVTTGGWLEVLEQAFDSEPSRWEHICESCGGHVAAWDLHCRHCGQLSPIDDPTDPDQESPAAPSFSDRAAGLLRRTGARDAADE